MSHHGAMVMTAVGSVAGVETGDETGDTGMTEEIDDAHDQGSDLGTTKWQIDTDGMCARVIDHALFRGMARSRAHMRVPTHTCLPTSYKTPPLLKTLLPYKTPHKTPTPFFSHPPYLGGNAPPQRLGSSGNVKRSFSVWTGTHVPFLPTTSPSRQMNGTCLISSVTQGQL